MRTYGTLVRRELGTYFVSWTGYVVIAMILLLLGVGITLLLGELNGHPTARPLTELFTPYFWMVVIPATPVICMRLFSQERAAGTFETLMTAPVSDVEVVLAKFSAAYFFYLLMWIPLLGGVAVLRRYLIDPKALEPGLLISTYFGMSLVGAVFIALGTFCSSLTRSQLNAAIISFGLGAALFLIGMLALYPPFEKPAWTAFFAQVSLLMQLQDFARGAVDTRHLVFLASLTVAFLYLTLKVVESRRWK